MLNQLLIRVPMILVRGGSVLLIIAALLYVNLGYPYVSQGVSNLDGVLAGELKAVWLGFSLHLFFIAYLLMVGSRRSNPHRIIVALSGLIILVDSLLIRVFVANTIGAQVLMMSGLAVLLGSFLWILFERGMTVSVSNSSLTPTAL